MAGFTTVCVSVLAVLAAVVYQTNLHYFPIIVFGLNHALEPLGSFPYRCRRLEDPQLQACEDMWLSERTRQLFVACSNSLARQQWMPNLEHFNVSGRSLRDAVVVLDIDKPEGPGFRMRSLTTPGFNSGVEGGDKHLYLVGMGGSEGDGPGGEIRLWLVNMKPSIDPATGKYWTDQSVMGANQTVELFLTGPQATELKHLKTFASPAISTPNRPAPLGGNTDATYVVNDHGPHKTGWRNSLSPFLKTGNIAFCDGSSTGCREVITGLQYPNGLARGADGLLYVPSSMLGTIDVYQILPGGDLHKVESIHTGYGLDNLAVDGRGDLWAAAIPVGKRILDAFKDPYGVMSPATALRVRKGGDGVYRVDKILEDGEAEVLPGATSVVHDAATGRLFLSSVITPFMAVCDPA